MSSSSSSYSSIINVINTYHHLIDEASDNCIVEILNLFQDDMLFTHELFGEVYNKEGLKEILVEQLSLGFLNKIRQIPSGHSISIENNIATVQTYVITYFNCTPVIITHWSDQLVKIESSGGIWKFKARKCIDVQKNFELLAELQLKGKKKYSQ